MVELRLEKHLLCFCTQWCTLGRNFWPEHCLSRQCKRQKTHLPSFLNPLPYWSIRSPTVLRCWMSLGLFRYGILNVS
jgi:hypothetical protein